MSKDLYPSRHTDACLERSVDAFCDGKPDPGCTCDQPRRKKVA